MQHSADTILVVKSKRISPRIRIYIFKTALAIESVDPGVLFDEKNQRLKILWDCPFKHSMSTFNNIKIYNNQDIIRSPCIELLFNHPLYFISEQILPAYAICEAVDLSRNVVKVPDGLAWPLNISLLQLRHHSWPHHAVGIWLNNKKLRYIFFPADKISKYANVREHKIYEIGEAEFVKFSKITSK
jgi:hypothetical protein